MLKWVNGKLHREEYLRFHDKLMDILLPKATPQQRTAIQSVRQFVALLHVLGCLEAALERRQRHTQSWHVTLFSHLQRDWRVDAGPDDGLSLEKFCRAVFELADQWTTTTEAAESVGAFVHPPEVGAVILCVVVGTWPF